MIFLSILITINVITIILISQIKKFRLSRRIVKYLLINSSLTIMSYFLVIYCRTTSYEIWSGKIIAVHHIEEYNQRIGNLTILRNARNYVETSDWGKLEVCRSVDGKTKFNNSFPNTNKQLEKFYPINASTASVHAYKNKVRSSYSIYKHKNIKLKEYKNLPKYPVLREKYIEIDRFLGEINNKDKVLKKLADVNSDLNSKEKNKQVNLMFINLKDKPENYGFALQDYWKGGNKNDFIVCFGSNNNKINWVYPFSWADSQKSEKLKIDVRDYMLKIDLNDDFTKVIDDIGKMIEENFERKQFADFSYLTVEAPKGFYIFIIITNIYFAIRICRNAKQDAYQLTRIDEPHTIYKLVKTDEIHTIYKLAKTDENFLIYKIYNVNKTTKKKKKRKRKRKI